MIDCSRDFCRWIWSVCCDVPAWRHQQQTGLGGIRGRDRMALVQFSRAVHKGTQESCMQTPFRYVFYIDLYINSSMYLRWATGHEIGHRTGEHFSVLIKDRVAQRRALKKVFQCSQHPISMFFLPWPQHHPPPPTIYDHPATLHPPRLRPTRCGTRARMTATAGQVQKAGRWGNAPPLECKGHLITDVALQGETHKTVRLRRHPSSARTMQAMRCQYRNR